jgi:hypothetical protein
MSNYAEEYRWRKEAMTKLRLRLSKAPNMKVFNQILKVFENHVNELCKIDQITRSTRSW